MVSLSTTGATRSYYPYKDALTGFENVIGSSGEDDLRGDAGANLLQGGGGADTLTGRDGADQFKFLTTGDGGSGGDSITDFVSGTDQIQVVSPNFAGLAEGPLAADRFKVAGTTLTSTAAVFLFNATTGALAFDPDGNGSTAATTIASLTNSGPKILLASDIQVVAA